MTIDEAGRRRIAELVRAAMGWQGVTGARIEAGGRLSRATVDRVKRADERVSDTMLRALGDALDLPRDFLIYVGEGDIAAVEASTRRDAELRHWTVRLIRRDLDGGSTPNVVNRNRRAAAG